MTTNEPDRLWGLPGAEDMRFTAIDAYELQIDGDGDGPWTLEEWSIDDPADDVPAPVSIVEWIAEQATDEFTDGGDTYHDLTGDDAVAAAALILYETVGTALRSSGWRQAGQLIAEHEVTVTVHDDGSATAFLDGAVLAEHPAPQGCQ